MSNIKQDNKRTSKILSIIVDLIIIPLIILAFISSITMINAKRHNKVPSFMGYSVVTILSPSMDTEEYGQNFKVGEVVVLKNCGVKDVKVGDIVAFYKPNETMVIFHRVVAITKLYNSDNGTDGTYIATQGDANGDIYNEVKNLTDNEKINISLSGNHYVLNKTDGNNIIQTYDCNAQQIEVFKSDFLVGKYVQNAGALSKVINFCSSTVGIVLLVCIPSAVLFFVLIIQMSKEGKKNREEKEDKYENIEKLQPSDNLNNADNTKNQKIKVDDKSLEEKLKMLTESSNLTMQNLNESKTINSSEKVIVNSDSKSDIQIKTKKKIQKPKDVIVETTTNTSQATEGAKTQIASQDTASKQPTSTPKKVPIVKPPKVSEDSNNTKPKVAKPTIKNKPE